MHHYIIVCDPQCGRLETLNNSVHATNVSSVFVTLTTEEIQNSLEYTKPDDLIAVCPAMDINNISNGPFGQNILFDFC